jgi:hypothetical protein
MLAHLPHDEEAHMRFVDSRRYIGLAAVILGGLVIAACGDDNKDKSAKPATLSVKTTDVGKKQFAMSAPKSIKGGTVTVRFTNGSKVQHEAQLIRIDGGHTVDEALKIVTPEKVVLPAWFHAEGGVGSTPPGASGTATLKLPPGDYAVIDTDSDDGPPPSAMGAKATFKVTGDNGGDVADLSTKVEVKAKGDDEFEFLPSNLKAGTNRMTFDNTSDEIHHVLALPLVGSSTLADVKKFLATQGKASGPPPVEFDKGSNTAVLDGTRKEITTIKLKRGRNVLICFLTDRDGKGKPHFQEGLLKEVNVQ